MQTKEMLTKIFLRYLYGSFIVSLAGFSLSFRTTRGDEEEGTKMMETKMMETKN